MEEDLHFIRCQLTQPLCRHFRDGLFLCYVVLFVSSFCLSLQGANTVLMLHNHRLQLPNLVLNRFQISGLKQKLINGESGWSAGTVVIGWLTVTSGTAGAGGAYWDWACDSYRDPLSLLSTELLLLLWSLFVVADFFEFKMFGFGLSSAFDFFVTLSWVPFEFDTYPPCTMRTRSCIVSKLCW